TASASAGTTAAWSSGRWDRQIGSRKGARAQRGKDILGFFSPWRLCVSLCVYEYTPMSRLPELSPNEVARYSRRLILPEVGVEGQQRLKAASVLLIGAGGLGSPLGLYLAAAGVGRIGLVDFDVVDFSNLQRQVLHGTPDVGRPKLHSARDRLRAINPDVRLDLYEARLTSANALSLFEPYDVIIDGTDNFPTRYLVNAACLLLKQPT